MRTKSTKVGDKYQVVIPQEIRAVVGLEKGQFVEVSPGPDGSIILRQQVLLDKNSFDAALKRSVEEAEVAAAEGRVLGPFDDAPTALRAVKKRAHARRAD